MSKTLGLREKMDVEEISNDLGSSGQFHWAFTRRFFAYSLLPQKLNQTPTVATEKLQKKLPYEKSF